MNWCAVCGGDKGVSEMTDGRTHHAVCDACREMVTAFFYCFGSLAGAVQQASQAKQGTVDKR